MLAKSKLNTIKTLISRALIDMDISYEKDKYERMKDNWGGENEKYMSNNISWKQFIKLWDWRVWNQRFKWKIIACFVSLKKKIFFGII